MKEHLLAGSYLQGPPDPRVERLARWLRRQPDAPGILEAAADAIGLDALVLDRGDERHRLRRIGGALLHEIDQIPRSCSTSRRGACLAEALRVLEEVLCKVKKARLRGAIRDALVGGVEGADLN